MCSQLLTSCEAMTLRKSQSYGQQTSSPELMLLMTTQPLGGATVQK
jgi:hypothetical protein